MRWIAILRLLIGAGATALACGCATTGAVPRPFPTPSGTAAPEGGTIGGSRIAVDSYALTSTALALRGAPYRDGGTDPGGFDCSGFTQYVFAQHGIALPRDVREQFRVGTAVKPGDLAPGDLLFFETVAAGASHVAIAIGADEFVHAPSSRGVVRVERLSSPYWSRRYIGARRLK